MNVLRNRIIAITVLVLALLTSVMQFHSHDCCGHVRIEGAVFELHIECGGGKAGSRVFYFSTLCEYSHCVSCNLNHEWSSGESSKDNADYGCAFHLSKVQLTDSKIDLTVASHEIISFITQCNLGIGNNDTPTLQSYNPLIVSGSHFADFACASNLLRGSPSIA